MHQVETELKWALDVAGHAALEGQLTAHHGPPRVLAQVNRFFDTPDLRLRQSLMNLRLRSENGRVLMTCKRRRGNGESGLHTHDEWEEWLPANILDLPTADLVKTLPLPSEACSVIGDSSIVNQGHFSNRRLEWHVGGDLLCLDATDFGVRLDHELEIETSDPAGAHARWSSALATWQISWRPEPTTKFKRFLTLMAAERVQPGGK